MEEQNKFVNTFQTYEMFGIDKQPFYKCGNIAGVMLYVLYEGGPGVVQGIHI